MKIFSVSVSLRTLATIVVWTSLTLAQDTKPLIQSEDTHYYDFWVGTWYVEAEGKVDTAGTRFIVRQSVHPAAFAEEWRMGVESDSTWSATAIRAWDKTNERWMYTWVLSNGLCQVWEGRKDKEHWYITGLPSMEIRTSRVKDGYRSARDEFFASVRSRTMRG
jgi:hypothetical protein